MAHIIIRIDDEMLNEDASGSMEKCLICSKDFFLTPVVISLHRTDGRRCFICYDCMGNKLPHILSYLEDYDQDIKEIREYFATT